jgi:hypothetical protein
MPVNVEEPEYIRDTILSFSHATEKEILYLERGDQPILGYHIALK